VRKVEFLIALLVITIAACFFLWSLDIPGLPAAATARTVACDSCTLHNCLL